MQVVKNWKGVEIESKGVVFVCRFRLDSKQQYLADFQIPENPELAFFLESQNLKGQIHSKAQNVKANYQRN